MTVQEKQAWFILWVIFITLILYCVIYMLLHSVIIATSAFALTAIIAFAGMIGRKERRQGKVVSDERDVDINKVAMMVAYSVFWLVFVFITVGTTMWLGPHGMVPVSIIGLAPYAGLSLLLLVRSVATIVLYRKGHDA